jgi:hypothetical protein
MPVIANQATAKERLEAELQQVCGFVLRTAHGVAAMLWGRAVHSDHLCVVRREGYCCCRCRVSCVVLLLHSAVEQPPCRRQQVLGQEPRLDQTQRG